MYHPSRGGVRGGRDQFKWDDVKVDKHRENYLGHSIKAPVGRWQKGKDLFWYARDKKSDASAEAMKEEIRRIKEEEEQAMREALGLAPKRASRPQGNRLDKHEYAELTKRGSTAEDMEGGHAEAALVQGLGLYKGPPKQGESSSLPDRMKAIADDKFDEPSPASRDDEIYEEEDGKKNRHREQKDEDQRREERKEDKRKEDKRQEEKKENKRHKHEKKRSHDSDDKHKHRHHRDKGKRKRHDSDSE